MRMDQGGQHTWLDGPHWTFATGLYAEPLVADACLALQDERGVDVIILMFALYAAKQRRIAFTDDDIRMADETVSPWRRQVIVSLRMLRRLIKTAPSKGHHAAQEKIRTHIKAAELGAEQVSLAMLAEYFEDRWRSAGAPAGASAAHAAHAANSDLVARIVAYFTCRGGPASIDAPCSAAATQAAQTIQQTLGL
jgi:uncharacterized protein (TIGR02444 family)